MRGLRTGKAWLLGSTVLTTLISTAVAAQTGPREGVHNGSFERGVDAAGPRPRHWYVGFPGEEGVPRGTWSLATTQGGGTALHLESSSEDGIFVSQVVDLPAGTMSGVTVTLSASATVMSAKGWAVAQLIALNPEVDPDPQTGIAHVGHVVLGTQEHGWVALEGEVELTGEAELLAVILVASGEGAIARFDDVSVSATLDPPGKGPDPVELALPATGPPAFPIGVTNESPRNQSDQAHADLSREAFPIVDLVNLFVHVRWNTLVGRQELDGHRRVVDQAGQLRHLGMARMVTLDFTHDSLAGLGHLNPLPDGTPVGNLDDPRVRDAYLDELLALVLAIEPTIVSVGIETDFFWERHPDQWPAFRQMLCTAHDRIEAIDRAIAVTTYFTLDGLLAADGSLDPDATAAMRELVPCIDAVGYSTYPADGTRRLGDIPAGTFATPAGVAPELPLIIPEFGYRSDGIYSEEEQAAFLRRVLDELSGHRVLAAVWYGLHDQTYLGVDAWFREAFRSIGLRRLDGTPKRSHALLERIHASGRTRRGGRRVTAAGQRTSGG